MPQGSNDGSPATSGASSPESPGTVPPTTRSSTTDTWPSYRGPDRRLVAGAVTISGARVTGWSAVATALAGALLVVLHLVGEGHARHLDSLALIAWSVPALGAAVLLACAWRLCGRALAAHLAAAAGLLAASPPLVLWASHVLVPASHRATVSAAAVMLAATAGFAGLARAVRASEVESDLRAARELGLPAALLALLTLGIGLGRTALPGLPLWPAVTAATVAFGTSSVALARAARPQHRALRASVTALPAVAALAAASFALSGTAGSVVRLLCAAAAGGLVASMSGDVLRWAFRTQGLRGLRALAAIARYEDDAAQERRRRHDARSALAAVRAASTTLAARGSQLDDDTRRDLAVAVREELGRVERLLDPAARPRPRVVDLTEVLQPALAAWRARGMRIDGPDASHLVLGDPDAVLRIVGNLLDNVYRHAGATSVRLTSRSTPGLVKGALVEGGLSEGALVEGRLSEGALVEAGLVEGDMVEGDMVEGDMVELTVSDNGIGIPVGCWGAVLDGGGCRGGRPSGSGLGLASARALAEAQGGRLRMADVPSGTAVVLSLPAAPVQARVTGSVPVPLRSAVREA